MVKSMIMNIKTVRALQKDPLPYDEVLDFMASERDATFNQNLAMMDEEAISRLPEEMRAGMIDMIKKAKEANENG